MRVLSELSRPIASSIMNNATGLLKSRILGGVTKKSTILALEYSANNAIEYGNKLRKEALIPVRPDISQSTFFESLKLAKRVLRKRFFGGYSKRSAAKAIEIATTTPILKAETTVDTFKKNLILK